MQRRPCLLMFLWSLMALVATCLPAHAYLDPGTGSYVVQVVLASVLGVAFAVKTYWLNLKTFLASLFSPKQSG